MRGLLRIRAVRAPYRRAGLAFADRQPVEIDIRDLDGARLLSLAADPGLSIEMGQDDGTFASMPAIDAEITAEVAQQMIDSLASVMPERPVTGASDGIEADPVAGSSELAMLRERNRAQADEIIRHVDRIAALERKLSEAEIDAGKIIGERDAEIAALKAKLDEARAAASSAKPKGPAKPRGATDKAGQAD